MLVEVAQADYAPNIIDQILINQKDLAIKDYSMMSNLGKKSTEDYKPIKVNGNKNEGAKVSFVKSFWNIVSCTTGVAILTIPFAIKIGGYFSVIAMVIVTVVSNYTAQILIKCHYNEAKFENSDKIILLRIR